MRGTDPSTNLRTGPAASANPSDLQGSESFTQAGTGSQQTERTDTRDGKLNDSISTDDYTLDRDGTASYNITETGLTDTVPLSSDTYFRITSVKIGRAHV